ncbi:ATP-dependent transcriptional regulator [Zymobacter palmae]|uniref:ATP-dependent transcriptional regulator n=1 Tax=Zymobacter palmae TaxID=33074 RepID=A0A348HHJ6_9GAMM|nr:ATP-dependent transcriptional regulator [Zymobacter palmae]
MASPKAGHLALLHRRQSGGDRRELTYQYGEQALVRCHQYGFRLNARRTVQRANNCASFFQQQRSKVGIVFVQTEGQGEIDTTGSEISQVQQRATRRTNHIDLRCQCTRDGLILFDIARTNPAFRQAHGNARVFDLSDRLRTHAVLIEARALAAAHHEFFIGEGGDQYGVLGTTLDVAGHGDRPARSAVRQVGITVLQFDFPMEVFTHSGTFAVRSEATRNTVEGIATLKAAHNLCLSEACCVFQQGIECLVFASDFDLLAHAVIRILSATQGTQGEFDHRLHGIST